MLLDDVFCAGVGFADEAFDVEAFDVEAFGSEIKEEAHGDFAGVEVVDANGRVFVGEGAGGFQLDDDSVFDDEVGDVVADEDAVVVDGDGVLLEDGEAELAWARAFS